MWIRFEDQKPKSGQHVYYYFDVLGVFDGYYEEAFSEELGTIEEMFYGKHGFLSGGEVTHWMPYTHERPPKPEIED